MNNENFSDNERIEAEIAERNEIEALKKMQAESVRKFKEKFPSGATIVECEFLE